MNQNILTIAQIFSHHTIISATPLGNGNINDTYLVIDAQGPFILQRLNTKVFPTPQLILDNQKILQKLLVSQPKKDSTFRIPGLILTRHGHSHHQDDNAHYWRAQEFIDQSQEIEELQEYQAESVGRILGRFHRLGEDQSCRNFHTTLPGLHATEAHLRQYTAQINTPQDAPQDILSFCRAYINHHQHKATLIAHKLQQQPCDKWLTHGDPKLANILFDTTSGLACSLIDLDTIGPGFIQHDLSDLIRSCCNPEGEDSPKTAINFSQTLAKKIITGYSAVMSPLLTKDEITLLGKSLWLMPFELGVRFLTDYLQGSTYFKTSSPHHNLARAHNQFQLTEQIIEAQPALEEHLGNSFSPNKTPK